MNIFPLKDGATIEVRGQKETVMGEIKPKHREPVCWTLQGNWYRRRDGVQMTGWNGRVMTVSVFYRLRRNGKLDGVTPASAQKAKVSA